MSKPALAVMARAPVPGKVKTRLQPYLTPEQSASLCLAFLKDALELAASTIGYTPFLFYTPPEMEAFFRQLIPPSVSLLAQSKGDLGQKMYHIFLKLGGGGYSPVVVVGSDLPTLQPSHLEKAIVCLQSCEVCLGPSHDGGYYLIGARGAHKSLFEGVAWSTPTVLQATISRAKAAGLSLGLLDVCSDVDTVEDLRRLRREIERLRQTPGSRVPRYTEAHLKGIDL